MSFGSSAAVQSPNILKPVIQQIFSTVATLKASNLKTGRFVKTNGYMSSGDGGGAEYEIIENTVVDGYGDHLLANGNVALLIANGIPNARQYGVQGTGDDSAAFQAAANKVEEINLTKGAYSLADISITDVLKINLSVDATIKSIPSLLAETVITSNVWSLTNKIFDVGGAGSGLIVSGGTIDCAGARPDAAGVSSGPNSVTPDFGEYAIHAEGADFLILKTKIINYLSDGLEDAPLGDLCIKANDTAYVDISGAEFEEIGNEILFVTSSIPCEVNMDGVKAKNSRGSLNVYDVDLVKANDGNYKSFSGSPLNLFSDNVTACRNYIKDVTNSHGIDLTEGLYRFRNQIATHNHIEDVLKTGVFGNGIDSDYSENTIIRAGEWGVDCDNTIGGIEESNTKILNNTAIDSGLGALRIKGAAGVRYKMDVKGNQFEQRSLIAGTIGVYLNNCADVDVDDNLISGFTLNHVKALGRINDTTLTRNKFKQPHGASNQTGDIILLDGNNDAITLNDILVKNNDFQALPPIGKHTVNIIGYALAYGQFPAGTNLQIADNTGVCLWKSVSQGVMYSCTKGNGRAGATLDGRFNGGDILLGRPTALGQPTSWRVLVAGVYENGVYTFRTSPTATISTTSGLNAATLSSSAHTIQAGDSIRILDIDGAGANFDTIVIERETFSGAVILRDTPADTAAGKGVQFLGTAMDQAKLVSVL